jgi:hypothetical protein
LLQYAHISAGITRNCDEIRVWPGAIDPTSLNAKEIGGVRRRCLKACIGLMPYFTMKANCLALVPYGHACVRSKAVTPAFTALRIFPLQLSKFGVMLESLWV